MNRRPGPSLAWVALAAALLFAGITLLVVTHVTDAFDVNAGRTVQAWPFGPLTAWMQATNAVSPMIQIIVAAALVLAFLVWRWRLAVLLFLTCIANLIDQILKAVLDRQPPPANRFLVPSEPEGGSYPSGHAAYFTWLCFMLAFIISAYVPKRWRILVWLIAAAQIVSACLGRVWLGVHWTTDVIGGFLLSLGWCCAILFFQRRFTRPALPR